MELTIKQEGFCMDYVECGNASEAYRRNYNAENMKPETINRKAKELMDNGKISARVAELQASHVERHNVTVDSISTELEEARKAALEADQNNAAIQASMGKAKLHGLLKDQVESKISVDMPLAEANRILEEIGINPESLSE